MNPIAEQAAQGAGQAGSALWQAWNKVASRARSALARLWSAPAKTDRRGPPAPLSAVPRLRGWAFTTAHIFDGPSKVVVRVEAPGMRREDLRIKLHGHVLTVWGEKRIHQAGAVGRWHITRYACGPLRRDLSLAAAVDACNSKASYRDGVLRIELPKSDAVRGGAIALHLA
ncbi:Hsp20/alpha crystallin family protein [Acidovorax sp.]|uniref:Hsp20/alpha crystallin family protein n=1 Tax=Acidovorax sp. TaxID=1872122 RepID=UPI002ACDA2CB|nr:Hsp20/alpha crystallin family protein [Acidovorax sp.]MDZ7864161.1 Hsp20/alpha crystallin family protein [Acidovorax sp.]